MKNIKRLQYTLPSKVPVDEDDLKFVFPPENYREDWTLVKKVPEWLRNFEVNFETIGFERNVADLPSIEGSALVVDKSMASRVFYEDAGLLRKYKGCLIVCDRALPYLCRIGITPDIVCQIDSSFLCKSFFEDPSVKKVSNKIKGVFATTTFTLTIREFHGERYFFTPFLGAWRLTLSLAKLSNTPILTTGGQVATLGWVLAVALGANPVGIFGIMNSYEDISETEYPDTPHRTVKNKYGTFYQDEVYKLYADIHHALIKVAKKKFGVETYNLSRGGVMYGRHIKDATLAEFIERFKK